MSYVRLNPKKATGAITFASGWDAYSPYDKHYVIDDNGIVNCSFRCKPTQNVSRGGWRTIGSITPTNNGVYSTVFALASVYVNGAYSVVEARIINGTLDIYPSVDLPSGTECSFNFAYTTD